jgi:hypothetical protein
MPRRTTTTALAAGLLMFVLLSSCASAPPSTAGTPPALGGSPTPGPAASATAGAPVASEPTATVCALSWFFPGPPEPAGVCPREALRSQAAGGGRR